LGVMDAGLEPDMLGGAKEIGIGELPSGLGN
jgi:hypothetical protein